MLVTKDVQDSVVQLKKERFDAEALRKPKTEPECGSLRALSIP